MSNINIARFDASDYLDSEEMISAYFNEALESDDMDALISAIADIAKARGMSKVAADAGLGRESLYKALSPGAKPRFDTILKLIHALGLRFTTIPESHRRSDAVHA